MIDWLLRILDKCMESGVVPEDWKAACIIPVYKGKGDRRDCVNYRGISILSIPGKIYGRILLNRVIESMKVMKMEKLMQNDSEKVQRNKR